jgi:hypothetical protein
VAPTAPKDAALRKRTQIAKANRTMFIWIAGASVIVGFAIVVAIFLGQKLLFNEKVLAAKNATVATLDKDNKVIPDLEDQVRVLNTNEALASVKAQSDDQAVQVILDALPSEANSSAFGASLQNKLLSGIPNLTIDSLQVTPVQGVESLNDNSGVSSSTVTGPDNSIQFHAVLIGNTASFRTALTNLERSIRIIDVTAVHITSAGSVQNMTIDGAGFYEPAVDIQLTNKVVKP